MLAALDYALVRNIAIGLAVVLVLLALLVAKVVRSVTTKAITILILGALILAVFTQRQSLTKCEKNYVAQSRVGATCQFFGYKVQLPALTP